MKASEILRRYAEGDRNFQRMNLRGLSFKGKDLSGADFSESDLRGTNFSRANLTGAKFQEAEAGLQKRWVAISLVICLLLSGLSGFLSGFAGYLVALVFDNDTTNIGIGWVSLVVVLVFCVIGVRKGAVAIAFTGAIAFAFAVVFAFAVAGAVAIGGTGAGAGAVAVAGAGAVAVAVIFAFAVTVAGAGAVIFVFAVTVAGAYAGAGAGAVAYAYAFAVALTLLGFYLARRAMKEDPRDTWIRNAAIVFATTGGTTFYKANLTDANFSKAKLKSTDLREAILTHTCWQNTEKLDRIRPGNTILKNPQVRKLLKTGNGYNKSFQKANLRGANLQGANLEKANLKQADLSEALLHDANLKDTNLTETLAIGTDFTGAYLTGACLEAWNIDPTTILDRIDCQYVFLLEHPNTNGSRERRPHHPDKTFDRGDFEKLYKQLMNTVQFLLKNGINREAFREAFQQIIAENPEITWDSIQKIERKGEDVLVEVTVSETTDKAKIEHTFDTTYQDQIAKLEAKIDELQILRHQDMKDIAFALSTHPQITQTMNNNPQTNKGIFLDNTQGNVNISNSANIENLNSTITNQINELPATSEPEKPGIKELLEQLQTAINADENLSDADKNIALEQVQNLVQAGKEPKSSTNQGIAKRAFLMLQGLITGLPAAAKLAETCQKIIPTISAIFGL